MTEVLASLKTENKDIVQGSVNLVTQQNLESYLPANYLYNGQSEKRHSVLLVSHSNQREDFSSMKEPHKFFGNFHQNDRRFSDQTRGFQCTCNALCMFIHPVLSLDELLDDFEIEIGKFTLEKRSCC